MTFTTLKTWQPWKYFYDLKLFRPHEKIKYTYRSLWLRSPIQSLTLGHAAFFMPQSLQRPWEILVISRQVNLVSQTPLKLTEVSSSMIIASETSKTLHYIPQPLEQVGNMKNWGMVSISITIGPNFTCRYSISLMVLGKLGFEGKGKESISQD